jgi:hypothetical protein
MAPKPKREGQDRAGKNKPIDERGNQKLGKAEVNINVNAPRGTKAKAEGDGVFEDIRLTPQMGGSGSAKEDHQNNEE